MPYDLEDFPDAEVLVKLILSEHHEEDLTDANFGVDFYDASDAFPYCRIERIGGSSERWNDYPLVDVEWFARPTGELGARPEAKRLSGRSASILLGYPRSVTVNSQQVVLDRAYQTRSPIALPWEDQYVRRFGATYQLSVRR